MPFDSTANLLFSIGADTGDAEGNIARFRSLLGTDLAAMGTQFKAWSEDVLGSLSTVSGAMTAGVAVIGAAVVAAAAYAVEASHKYVEFAEQVEKGTLRTGLAAEDMSKLIYAGKILGVGYDALVGGLTKFSSYIVKSASDTGYASSAFAKLGISQEQVRAGEKDMAPLLAQVQDAMHGLASQVDRVAMARELMSRGGPALVQMLQLDSASMKQVTDNAALLGIVMTEKDLVAAKQLTAEIAAQKQVMEGFAITVGREATPALIRLEQAWLVLQKVIIDHPLNPVAALEEVKQLNAALDAQMETVKKLADSGGTKDLLPGGDPAKVKAVTTNFSDLSSMLEQTQAKTAAFGSDADQAAGEIEKLQRGVLAATTQFKELVASGTLDAETIRRESAALADMPDAILALTLQLTDQIVTQRKELADKQNEAILAAGEDLEGKLNAQREKGWAEELAAFQIEMVKLQEHLTKKGVLTAANQALLNQIESAGIEKLHKAQQAGWDQELVTLTQSLASLLTARMTAQQKIVFTYDTDAQRFSQVEENKSLKLAASEAERLVVSQLYAMNRKALLDKEQADLQALANSHGWQAVLGSEFGNLLRQDEAAWKQWSESANQASLMVQLSLTALKQIGEDTFNNFGKAMGQNIAQAIVYSTSIGQAMQKAAAAALESLAAESLTQAIYATALGFLRLAQYDTVGASAAFEAAAMFGLIGAASAVAGRAIAPPQSSTGTAAGTAAGAGPSSNQSVLPTNQNTVASNTGYVRIVINGSVIGASGIEELTGMINDAVQHRDVRMIASQVKSLTPVTR